MTSFKSESAIHSIISLLSKLCTPPENHTFKGGENGFDEVALKINIEKVIDADNYQGIVSLIDGNDGYSLDHVSSPRWNFVVLCIRLSGALNKLLLSDSDQLLSVKQKITAKKCVQLVISFGLYPSLLPSIVDIQGCTKNWNFLKSQEDINPFEKYRRICYVTNWLLGMCKSELLIDTVLPQHLSHLFSALCQLCFAPLKKPIPPAGPVVNSQDASFRMTEDMYQRLLQERSFYKEQLAKLVNGVYQPIAIESILSLHSQQRTPNWLKKHLSQLLIDQLTRDNGVISTVRIFCDDDKNFVQKWKLLESLAILFTAIYSVKSEKYTTRIAPQILQMLRIDQSKSYHELMCRAAALSIKTLYLRNEEAAAACYLNYIMEPLIHPSTHHSEERIGSSIQDIYNIFCLPSNDEWTLPYKVLYSSIVVIFMLHRRAEDTSVCWMKSILKVIMIRFLQNHAESTLICDIFNLLMFNVERGALKSSSLTVEPVLGCEGGLVFANSRVSSYPVKESCITLLHLIKECDENGSLTQHFFIYLLKEFHNKSNLADAYAFAEKRLIIASLLNSLANCEESQKKLLKDPKPIIPFIAEILDMYGGDASRNDDDDDDNTDVSIVTLCLVFLSVQLDRMKTQNTEWSLFCCLIKPLEKIKTHSRLSRSVAAVDVELVEEVYNLIRTHNLIGNLNANNGEKRWKNSQQSRIKQVSQCEKALYDACDPLLPVRAHALVQLINLLKSADQETVAKVDALLCLFQENLKDEDSYLYLKAVEGLATVAAYRPNDVITCLCEEYVSAKQSAEIRMKVGECLLRVVRILGDFVYVHKNQLLNTFLTAVRDEDALLRASSFSNLGELCRILNYNVGPILEQVLSYAQHAIDNDAFEEPRRAAVLLVSLLLQGLEKNMFTVLREIMLPLYRSLKHIYYMDTDETVRLQAQVALEQININTVDILTEKPTFTKRIYVLDSVPNE